MPSLQMKSNTEQRAVDKSAYTLSQAYDQILMPSQLKRGMAPRGSSPCAFQFQV